MEQPHLSLNQILTQWTDERELPAQVCQQLEAWELSDQRRAKAFGITANNVSEIVQKRGLLFASIYPLFRITFAKNPSLLTTLWLLWLPLGLQLAEYRQALGRPVVQGILGGQGTGKTTLAAGLTIILDHLGYRTLSLSLDDLYKTYAERQHLKEQDPRLIWRGPPGTHDVKLGIEILDQLRRLDQPSVQVPRFDKSAWGGAGDRTDFETVAGIDIVLFEGWFVGVRPIEPAIFDTAPAPIITPADHCFARDMNTKLHDYLPLWQRLDRLMVLYPVDYRLSVQWRQQAEHQMMAAGKAGMSDLEIEQFVHYFWKALHPELFIKPLLNRSEWVDLVVEINADHCAGSIYKATDSARQKFKPERT